MFPRTVRLTSLLRGGSVVKAGQKRFVLKNKTGIPETIAVIIRKFEQLGITIQYCVLQHN